VNLSPRLQRTLALAAVALFAIAWFVHFAGWETLAPWSIDWCMSGDWSTHELGFLHYRNEPWALPLGKLTGMLYPVGTATGYTDSIPWLAVFFKIFSSWLPVDWQYIGPWIALCFVANGAAGLALARSGARELPAWHWVAGALLFVLTPTLLLRVGHPSLCAHALLLFGLWANVARFERVPLVLSLLAAANLFAAGIHPYLEVMVLALTMAAVARLTWEKRLRWHLALAYCAGTFAAVCLTFALFGYIGGQVGNDAGGFGAFSAELATFFNPAEFSRFFTPWPRGAQQYEGMAYLGLGIFFLDAVLLVCLAARWNVTRTLPWRRAIPLTIAAVALAVFALSSNITFKAQTLLDLSKLYAPFSAVTGAFRSSGRFIWPLHYLCFAAPVVLLPLLWRDRPWVATGLLIAGVTLQLCDVRSDAVTSRWKKTPFHRLSSEGWPLATVAFSHLELFPADIWDTPCRSIYGYRDEPILPLSYEAYRRHLTYNSGYVARHSPGQAEACATLEKNVAAGVLDPDSVYVTYPPYRPFFDRAGAVCGKLDGLDTCVARERGATPLALFLLAHP
jgi:hypothetical protein